MTKEDIPYRFACCYATPEQCTKCSTCSHAIAGQLMADDLAPLTCIHPLYINKVAAGQACEYFSELHTIRLAYGFAHMFEDVPERLASSARAHIRGIFTCRSNYYRARRGEQAIQPKDQERFARIFRQVGIEGTPKFDRYEEQTLW